MKIKEITFDQLIQVKAYEPCRISATASVDEGEDPAEATAKLKSFVQDELKKVYYKDNPDKAPKAEPVKTYTETEVVTKTVAATTKNNSDDIPDL